MLISDTLKENIDFLKEVNFSNLVRAEDLGKEYKFEEEAKLLENIYKDLNSLVKDASLLRVDDEKIAQIDLIAKNSKEQVEKINIFKLVSDEGNAQTTERQAVTNAIRDIHQRSLKHIQPLLDRLSAIKLDTSEIKRQSALATTELKEIKKIKEDIEKEKKVVDTDLQHMRESFGEKGAVISSGYFGDQADTHSNSARIWLVVSVISIIGVGILIWLLFKDSLPESSDIGAIARYSILRLTLLSLAYIIVSQSIKNYRVNQHLTVLNRHRHLSLSVYPNMVAATTDPNHSNIILGSAAEAIFRPVTSGYLGKDDDKNPVNLSGIVNRVTGSDKA